MRHFAGLPDAEQQRLFARRPETFTRDSDVHTLAVALGATLYLPGTRPRLADDLVRQSARGVVSAVVCLEDAVADSELTRAQANVVAQLGELARRQAAAPGGVAEGGPLVFVRVRHPEQIAVVVGGLGDDVDVLSGFVLPKFTGRSGPAFLEALDRAATASGRRLLAMPVLESPELIHRETRQTVLSEVQALLAEHRDVVLAVRIGATDLCAAYGLRRDRDLTVYDVRLVADVIADVVNVLGRVDGGHVVTGPVWEHFSGHERLFKPQLRQSPFEEHDAGSLRHHLLTRDLDGLIREIVLDKANGLTGKTVIHPSHIGAVHALSVVTHEEFADATDIVGDGGADGGVASSSYRNKMNELKPHRAWAERVLRRARAFGVAAEDVSVVDLLAAETVP